ncbi:response regulator [Candidatus Pacearchaeota archaeon]|nr:response regulator [Candidatus Pacearchaeota archaeon]
MVDKILIVDDNKNDREVMKRALEADNYKVFVAGDGAVALDLLETEEIGTILLDIKMPTLSGYDLLRLLKRRVKNKIKIIYVSIIPQGEVDMKDADEFLQKPFSPENLLNIVKEVIDK